MAETEYEGVPDEGASSPETTSFYEPPAEESQESREAEPAEGGEAEQPWDGVTQEDWEGMVYQNQRMTDALNTMGQALANYVPVLDQIGQYLPDGTQAQVPELPEIDPFDPDSVQQWQDAVIQRADQVVQARMQPFEAWQADQAEQRGIQNAGSILDQIAADGKGDFNRGAALSIAMMGDNDNADPVQLLYAAASYQRDMEAKLKSEAVEEYKKQMAEIAGAPRASGAEGFSAGERGEIPTGYGWARRAASQIDPRTLVQG